MIYSETKNEYAIEFAKMWESELSTLANDIKMVDNEPDDLNVTFLMLVDDLEVALQYISGCGMWLLSVASCIYPETYITRLPLVNDEKTIQVVKMILDQIDY